MRVVLLELVKEVEVELELVVLLDDIFWRWFGWVVRGCCSCL